MYVQYNNWGALARFCYIIPQTVKTPWKCKLDNETDVPFSSAAFVPKIFRTDEYLASYVRVKVEMRTLTFVGLHIKCFFQPFSVVTPCNSKSYRSLPPASTSILLNVGIFPNRTVLTTRQGLLVIVTAVRRLQMEETASSYVRSL